MSGAHFRALRYLHVRDGATCDQLDGGVHAARLPACVVLSDLVRDGLVVCRFERSDWVFRISDEGRAALRREVA